MFMDHARPDRLRDPPPPIPTPPSPSPSSTSSPPTAGDWDDGLFDGSKYTVDIPNFVPAEQFGSAVTASLKDVVFQGTYSGVIGLDDNVPPLPEHHGDVRSGHRERP